MAFSTSTRWSNSLRRVRSTVRMMVGTGDEAVLAREHRADRGHFFGSNLHLDEICRCVKSRCCPLGSPLVGWISLKVWRLASCKIATESGGFFRRTAGCWPDEAGYSKASWHGWAFFFLGEKKKKQEEGEESGREDVVKSANKYKKLLQRDTNSLDSRVLKNKMGNTMVFDEVDLGEAVGGMRRIVRY